MINYFRNSFKRKKARRITQEYASVVKEFDIKGYGKVEFAQWDNPLVTPLTINSQMVEFFGRFIKEGDLAIDIGANIGDTTVPMALAAGNSGMALGFDPNPYVYKVLVKNASLNKGKMNLVPCPYAITVEEEEFYFISSEASFSNGGISPTKDSSHGKFIYPEKIKGVNLKKFLEENYKDRLEKISFIKIDTEGYDKEIIKSVSDLISKYKPVLVAESFGKSSDEAKMELFEVIDQHGYNIFYFEDFDSEAEEVKINSKEEMINWKGTINIYAVPV